MSYIPSLGQITQVFEPQRLAIQDVENLRPHYALTLRHWLQRFDEHVADVEAMFDAAFVRAWRLYLAASLAGFTRGDLQLFQVVFTRWDHNDIPWSRAFFYHDSLLPERPLGL